MSSQCHPNVIPMSSKCHPNEPKMEPNDHFDDTITKKNTKKHICQYCNKEYSTNSHLRRHEKTCKVKKEYEQNKCMQLDILKQIDEKLTKIEDNKGTIINNIQNKTINYLNVHFSNMQPIEHFLENLKTNY